MPNTVPTLTGRAIRSILFDFGDTLWTRNDETTWRHAERAGNQRAIAVLRKHFATLPTTDTTTFGDQLRRMAAKHTSKMQPPGYEPDFALATLGALQELGLPTVERAKAAEIFEALRLRIPESRHLFDDILPTLEELRRRGFLLGVVTNRQYGGKLFLEDLKTLGLLDYFSVEHIAISADLGVRKPNAAIYLHALNALGVLPEEAAMVGDSIVADVVGAKLLNLFAVWKPKPSLRREVRILLPEGTQHIDDRRLVAYAYHREAKKYQLAPTDDQIEPDLIIEHLSELLDVFKRAGKQ